MFKRLFLLITICCISCYPDSFDTKELIGMTKQDVLRQTFKSSPRTKQREIIIFTWNANGSIISHSYSSLEKALSDSDSLLNKDIWALILERNFHCLELKKNLFYWFFMMEK